MAKLTKAQRAAVHAMFDGRCAYCGEVLSERWHADHKEPIMRGYEEKTSDNPHGAWHVHRDTLENLMPACAPCNLDKASYSVDQWRRKLEGSAVSLARYSSTYRHALRFGLLREILSPIVFYFERAATPSAPQAEEAPIRPTQQATHISNKNNELCREIGGQQATSGPPSHEQLSIDTQEFRELVGKVYKRTSFSFLTPNTETEALIAHIDAKLTQARREGWIAMESAACNAEAQNADEWRARTEKAEAQLAAIHAGVEGLKSMTGKDISVFYYMETEDFVNLDDIKAILAKHK